MLAKLRRCTRGAVAVEAAIILPVFLLLVLATIEFSLALFTLTAMQHAARDLSRQLAVNLVTDAQVKSAVANYLPGWATETTVEVVSSHPLDPANNRFSVILSLPAAKAAPTSFALQLVPGWQLSATVSMKQELPL